MSTTKVAFMAIVESFKETKWLKGLVDELCPKMSLVNVHCDSQSAYIWPRIKTPSVGAPNTFT